MPRGLVSVNSLENMQGCVHVIHFIQQECSTGLGAYVIEVLVVTKSLCGFVSNQVQYNMESALSVCVCVCAHACIYISVCMCVRAHICISLKISFQKLCIEYTKKKSITFGRTLHFAGEYF